jgi:hypothetical protein
MINPALTSWMLRIASLVIPFNLGRTQSMEGAEMRKLFFGLVLTGLVACGGTNDATGPIASAEGTWRLQTINGSPMPYTTAYNAGPPVYKVEILSDAFVASSNGTWTDSTTTRQTNGSNVFTQITGDHGTWAQTIGSVSVTSATTGTTASGAITGNTITVTGSGSVLVYQRQ